MAIDITLGELAAAEPVLKRLVDLAWPPKPSYHVRKLASLADAELRHWHAQREAWIRELGAEAANGTITVKPEHFDAYVARLKELGEQPVSLAWRPLTLEDLERAEEPGMRGAAKFSPAELLALGRLLAEPAG